MARVKVRYQTIVDDTRIGLLGRVECIIETLRNRGDKIVAIVPSPKETDWAVTIFHEYEVDE